jgi:AraC-like DNA-binding protein
MADEIRTVTYDKQLNIEAYRLKGIKQDFPNHFHEFYVIGFVEKGHRYLVCNQKEYWMADGDVNIFNPLEPHACKMVDGKTMDYLSLNIKPEVMQQVVKDILGEPMLPRFAPTVLYRSDTANLIGELHAMICAEQIDFKKEELFFLLIEQLLRDHSDASLEDEESYTDGFIDNLCRYLEDHYNQSISLDELSSLAGVSKYHMLRTFTKQKGISPYSYLETIRIGKAKQYLEKGMIPLDAAFQTGFSDQSHFTNYFKKLIGLTPKQYQKIFSAEQKNSE